MQGQAEACAEDLEGLREPEPPASKNKASQPHQVRPTELSGPALLRASEASGNALKGELLIHYGLAQYRPALPIPRLPATST